MYLRVLENIQSCKGGPSRTFSRYLRSAADHACLQLEDQRHVPGLLSPVVGSALHFKNAPSGATTSNMPGLSAWS